MVAGVGIGPNLWRLMRPLNSPEFYPASNMVGVTGFEPAASPPRTERSTQTELHTERWSGYLELNQVHHVPSVGGDHYPIP